MSISLDSESRVSDQGDKRRGTVGHAGRRGGTILNINLLVGLFVSHDQPNTWGRGDRSSILSNYFALDTCPRHTTRDGKNTHLVTEPTHASSNGLLDHLQGPETAVMAGDDGSEVVGRA